MNLMGALLLQPPDIFRFSYRNIHWIERNPIVSECLTAHFEFFLNTHCEVENDPWS